MKITPELIEEVFADIDLPSEQSIGQSDRNHERLLNPADPFLGSKWRQEGAKEKHGERQSAMMKQRVSDPTIRAQLIQHLSTTWDDPELAAQKSNLMKKRFADPEYMEQYKQMRSAEMQARMSDPTVRAAIGKKSKEIWDSKHAAYRNSEAYALAQSSVNDLYSVIDRNKKGAVADACRLILTTLRSINCEDSSFLSFCMQDLTGCSGVYARTIIDGVNKQRGRCVMTPYGKFNSLTAAAKHYNTTSGNVSRWLKTKPSDFYYADGAK